MAFFIITPEDEAQANALVIDLLEETTCLAQVRGADMPELTRRVAGAICRARVRAERARMLVATPTPIPGPGVDTPKSGGM